MSVTASHNAMEHFKADYQSLRAVLAGAQPTEALAQRDRAMASFCKLGVPTSRDEEWKFTNLARLERTRFALAPTAPVNVELAEIEPYFLQGSAGARLVFVNGSYAPRLSRTGDPATGVEILPIAPAGATIADLLASIVDRCAALSPLPFALLNTALTTGGAIIRLSPEARCVDPIQLIFATSAGHEPISTYPRLAVVAGVGSSATIVENHVSLAGAPSLTVATSEFFVDDNASIDHAQTTELATGAIHLGAIAIEQRRDSRVSSSAISRGGAITRNDFRVSLDGDGADCTLRGLAFLTGDQHVDNHLLIRHAAPNCTSREHFKNVLAGSSRGVFGGRIYVDPEAQKTDGVQTNASLLLSGDARAESQPQLEIYADDVKCTHGATVGQLDESALFYMRARGICEQDARTMLIRGFAEEVLDEIRVEALRDRLKNTLFSSAPSDAVVSGRL